MRYEELFNNGWEFVKMPFGTGMEEVQKLGGKTSLQPGADDICTWQKVTLPHDWLIYDTKDLYGDATGWYRKTFTLAKEPDRRYLLNFDGVYMDSTTYVNGVEVGHNHYGYSSFEFDITDVLQNGENTVMVRVDHKSPNTRWYSGAGIFRDVILKCVPTVHIATNGVYISSKKENGRWLVYADTEICDGRAAGDSGQAAAGSTSGQAAESGSDYDLQFGIRLLPALPENSRCIVKPCPGTEDFVIDDASKGDSCFSCEHPCAKRDDVKVSDVETRLCGLTDSAKYAGAAFEFATSFAIDNPFVWDITAPNLYELIVKLVKKGASCEPAGADNTGAEDVLAEGGRIGNGSCGAGIVDEVTVRFGLREAVFTSDKGFLLNGRQVKLQGMCEHHDLGCLGAAFHKDAFRRKIIKLKEMGVNAIRTSHNMPARGLVELADEMGILLDDEAFDMWRRAKTEFDYARFFDEDYVKDVASWVRRDRSNPSVIMWSTGNEIYDCHADESAQDLIRDLKKNVEMHDYRGNGVATFASNYMPWEGAQKCADILKLAGYNYAERLYRAHHEKYPDWTIYGSETCSTVQSRGIYHFPMNVPIMADDDEQCSALGNSTTSWGAENVEYVLKAERDHDFSAGQFVWTGFDYIGEPTPYHTKNSYFGQLDTAGFEKDTFYIFKGEWTDPGQAPFVHVFPYWDFNEGQIIDVRIASNAPCTELFVNGISHGKKYVDHAKGAVLCPTWQVPYHKGYIEAVAYDENGKEIARQRRSSFGDVSEVKYRRFVTPGAGSAGRSADGVSSDSAGIADRLAYFEIYALDSEGNEVENANCRVNVKVKNGTLLGLDNGDSTDFDQYKCDSRRMFSGRLLAIAAPDEGVSADRIELELEIDTKDVPIRKIEICCVDESGNEATETSEGSGREGYGSAEEVLKDHDGDGIPDPVHFYPGHTSERVEARIYPPDATYNDIVWAVVNDHAASSNLAVVEPEGSGSSAVITSKGDGRFRLRCMTHNGTEKLQCISTLEFSTAGVGTAYLDPYDFISGTLYTDSKGDVGNGNEKGVATPRDEDSYIGYENIDFGEFGSDEITIPIFTLDGNEYEIGIWEGRPGDEGSRLLLDGRYCKPSIWNVYQPETFKLDHRVKGVTSIYFTAREKFHIKGFSFTKPDKAFAKVYAAENSRIYGDSFNVEKEAVTGIGNNVTLEFDDMAFNGRKAGKLTICGLSRAQNNSIHLKLNYANGESEKTMLEFGHTDDYEERTFDISSTDTKDCVKVEFVFLPGSDFDFRYFVFGE